MSQSCWHRGAGQSSTLMIVTFNGVASPPMTVSVAPSAPGLFSANSSGTGNGAIGNHDGSVNSPSNPEARGSVIVLYGTGEGQSNPRGVDGRIASAVYPKPLLPVKVTIGGVDATAGILYAGAAPTLVTGVFQNQCDSAAECADGRGAGGGDNRAGPRQPTDPGPIPPTIRQRSPYPQVGFTGRLPFISEGHSKIKGLRVSKVSLISDFMSSG